MTTPNPYDREDTCRCSAWSESECACGGYVDRAQVRAWQRGYDAAIADERERIAQEIENQRPEMGPGINIGLYRQGLDDGMTRALEITRGQA